MKKYRLLQLITGVHYVHHLLYSFGFKVPFIELAYFKNYGWRKINDFKVKDKNGKDIKPYHNCSITGNY